jgi:hypothetical protein
MIELTVSARPPVYFPPDDQWRWETGTGHRTFGEWHEDPWADPADKARRKRERHQRWIASISDRDWERLARRADAVTAGGSFARMDDLDARIAIGVYDARAGHLPNGERFGILRGCVLMAWRKAP